MRATKKLATVLFILLSLCSCTITHYENYRFSGNYIEQKDGNKKDDTHAYIPIYNSIFKKKKTSLLRDNLVRKEPFYYYFTVKGNFEKIEKLNAFFIQNKKRIIAIPVTTEHLNQQKKQLKSKRINYFFSYGKKLQLPITWDKTRTLEVEVNFIGIEKGVKKKYKLKGEYKKDSIIENTNLKWDAIMGI
jgi:hypothetical protein